MRKVRRWLKKRHHSAESDEDFDGDCAGYLANGERRCSEPCRRCSTAPTSPSTERATGGGGATNQPRKRMGNIFSQMMNLNPLVGNLQQLPNEPGGRPQRRTSGGSRRQSLEFSGEVKREVLSNIRRVSGGERRMVGSGGGGVYGQHSRHSSLGDEPLHTEVIHENPEHEYVVNHRRHVSDSITQSSQMSKEGEGKYSLAKKVEPVSYPGGVKAHLARGQRFHAHDDIMPLVEDWYDSWNLLGRTPIMDPGNAGPSSEFVLDAKGGRGSTDNEIRRRTASLSTPHRASDVQVDPAQSAILFRDARGLPALNPHITVDTYQTLKTDETKIFAKFFGFHMCYDLIPTSAKLVVFDTQLLVKKAFFALVYNGVRAAPLWDSQQQRFVGMLTITDFIRILAMNYKSPSLEMEELEEHRLETWRNVLKDVKELIFIEPNASLYEAIKSLIHNKIHRLPVIDSTTGNVLYILTHKRILRFLFLYINDLPESSLLHKSVHHLNIGTYHDIQVASEDTPIIEALHKFVNKRISALPIVDKEHRLIDIYAKFDVINLAAEKTYSNLDVSLKEANKHRNEWFEGVHKCTKADTLFEVMDKIVKAEVHRLVIVDEGNVVCGMISLSDILNFLVLRPGGDDFFKKSVAETIKTEQNLPDQDNTFDKPESTTLEKLNNPDNERALNLSQESARSAEKKIELTCEEINEDPGVQSFDASDDVVENRESEERSLEINQDPVGDRLIETLDSQDHVANTSLPPLFIESATNSTPSSSPDPSRDLSAPCSPCPPNRSPCPPIINNDDRPITPATISKEFGKSDSMDSAFEATEEVDEEVDEDESDPVQGNDTGGDTNLSQDERLVHIQIVDAVGATTPPATPSPPPLTTCVGKLCDNNMPGENTTVLSCDMTGHTQSNKLQQILP